MMARRRALQLADAARDLPRLLKSLDILISIEETPDDLPEVYVPSQRIIAISHLLSPIRRRWYAAHGLGHALLHCGDQELMRRVGIGWVPKQEWEAEAFAGHVLCPCICPRCLRMLPVEKIPYRLWLERHFGGLAA